ncbi:membrane protein [Oceanobacillus picturae]|uniref:Membrane protein n=1 Tax=Oceanobacillus picturae TaxID=171693 RepID=A0A0U9HAN1_9BACI|nr:VC0807 family protein [Oceanobacillus picturae]GAQ17256.1 membrane protein [Oceanobacillus picturae]
MNKKLILLDIICYAVVPYLIWNYGREILGDYWAIILSTVPGFIYTVYRFLKEKQFNIAGLFILGSLAISTTVNLLSPSAESMLWNQVYLGLAYGVVYLLSILIKQPLALHFMVDWAYLQGYARQDSRTLYFKPQLLKWFQLLTLLFVARSIFMNGLKAFLLQTYGAAGYGKMLIYMNISGWIFSAVVTLGFVFIGVKINQYLNGGGEAKVAVEK